LEEERFFLIKEVERLVDLERELNYKAELETKKEEIVRRIDDAGMKGREAEKRDEIERLTEELQDEIEKNSGLVNLLEHYKLKNKESETKVYTGDRVDKKYKEKYLFYRTKVEAFKQENRQ
jgi:transcriptional accessory protein Tex/SPT6